MSDDRIQTENRPPSSNLHVINESSSIPSLSKNEEQQTVITVISKDDPEKVDKLVQTGSSTTTFKKVVLFSQRSFTKTKEAATNSLIDEESEDFVKEVPKKKYMSSSKPMASFSSPDKNGNRSTEARKPVKNNVTTPKPPDLTRKKLEAELKAAEEIARIKETVIEKRLALELASLEDSFDCHPAKKTPPTTPAPHTDKRPVDEPPKRVVPVMQDNVIQEREIHYDFYNRPIPSRPSLLGPSFPRQQSPIAGRLLKTDSNTSILTSFRSLNLTDKKFNIDKKLYGFNDSRTPSPTTLPAIKDFRCIDAGCKMAKRHTEYHQKQPSSSGQSNKARQVWKSAVTKIKTKMRNKSPPPSPPSR